MSQIRAQILEIPEAMQERMRGVTWHEELPSPRLHELRLLEIPYLDFAGVEQKGQLVTAASLAEQVVRIFAGLRDLDFPIAGMRPMIDFQGDDGLSMAANNSSCFNSRRIVNSDRISVHSYGAAIDINPVQNPVIRDGKHRPDAGAEYLDRENIRPGMFVDGGAALQVFMDAGWSWGGHWDNPKDYHHFFEPSFA
jgi:poly-gamma-glutamate synthesis protein (capsule biosynthesis protein)